ncbi:hypothetical protein, partial [Phascolarctobacterium succinatutens]|uniref:hypothetical protein n=1 Tax=Phascolarctobacterium succinatutens TaxID=626940 RepID=UPI0027B9DF11
LQAYIKKLLCIFSPMRLLAYPDSALGKRRECVVVASHSINGYESAILYPSAKNILKNFL